MPKILITGNGFDLFHFLPTSYKDFICILKRIEKLVIDSREKDISYEEIFDLGIDEREENYDVNGIFFNIKRIKAIQTLLKENQWYLYFQKIEKLSTWINFEKEIKKVLDAVVCFFEIIKDKIKFPITTSPLLVNNAFSYKDSRFLLIDDLEVLHIMHNLQILNLSSSFENSLIINSKYLKGFVFPGEESFSGYSSLNEQKILSDLIESFEMFKNIFNRYFIDIIQVFYSHVRKNDDSQLNYLLNQNLFSQVEYFFTFNYTSTLEKFYHTKDVEYIHGKINIEDRFQNIVLGVDDINNKLKQYKIFEFTKYFQKLNQNTKYQFINTLEKEILESKEGLSFYIWGLSVDESDKNYVNQLFFCLEKSYNNKIVIFYYVDKKNNKSSKADLLKNLLYIEKQERVIHFMMTGQLIFLELNLANIKKEFLEKITIY